MIKQEEFIITNKNGKEHVSEEKLKEALRNTKKLCSDGRKLYLQMDTSLWKRLDRDANLTLRMYLFDKEAQSKISRKTMETIMVDLIVDTNLLINRHTLNPADYVNFQNGIYDLKAKKLLDKHDKVVNKFKFSYMINAKFITAELLLKQMPTFMKFVEDTFRCTQNDEMFSYVLQNIGFLISSINNLRKAVVFIGAPASGKSTIANFLGSVIQPANAVSHVNFQDLGDKFRSYDAACAKLNIGDEMNKGRARNLANFKSLTAGEPIVIERKGRDPLWVLPNVRQVYCTNYLPTFDDGNAMAIFDRLNIIPFHKTIDEKNRDYQLPEKLWQERDAILSRAVEKFADVLANNGCFSIPDEVKNCKERYITQENSVEEFIAACLVEDIQAKGISSAELYQIYLTFCYANGLNLKTRADLREGILAYFPSAKYKRTRISPTKNVQAFCGISLRKDDLDDGEK